MWCPKCHRGREDWVATGDKCYNCGLSIDGKEEKWSHKPPFEGGKERGIHNGQAYKRKRDAAAKTTEA